MMSNSVDGEVADDEAGSDEPWPCAMLMYSTAVEFLNAQQEQDDQARLYLRGCIHTLWECAGSAVGIHDVPPPVHHANVSMSALRRARCCVTRAVTGDDGNGHAYGNGNAANTHAKDHTTLEVCISRAKTAQLPHAARQLLSAARVLAGRLIEWRSPASADLLYRAALAAVPDSADATLSLARSRWRCAWTSAQLAQVEELLRAAVLFADDEAASGAPEGPRQAERTQARRFLARLLWQSADTERQREALELLRAMGYRYVLHRAIVSPSSRGARRACSVSPRGRVFALDGALPPPMLSFMRRAFARDAQFWARHDYGAPRTGYFSYMHALPPNVDAPASGARGALETVLHRIWQVSCGEWPRLKRARFVEWWVHRRPHTAGHPLHFDYVMDEDDQPPRHPMASTVLFVDATCGGPTFVTDQTVSKGEATQGWTVQPSTNRLMAFDGKLLHCVLPGHGPSPAPNAQRLTFMAAFWERSPRAPAFEPKPRNATWAWAKPLVAPLSCGFTEDIVTCADAPMPRAAKVDYVPGVCEHVTSACADARSHDTSLSSRLRTHTKRQRLDSSSATPVNLLESDDVFVEFEALGSGLVTAKQGECSWGVDDTTCNVQGNEI